MHNPLAPGHLTPYRDWTKPVAAGLYIDNGGGPRALVAGHVGARDTLVVAATDRPAQPLTGRYSGLPQVPALVEWRLFHGGTSTAWRVAVDFRLTEPPQRGFWHVYAAGTYQNIPVFEHRCYSATPGRYLFRLGLDASRLAAGSHRLEVRGHRHPTELLGLVVAAQDRPGRRSRPLTDGQRHAIGEHLPDGSDFSEARVANRLCMKVESRR